jgi:predicted ATPase
VVARVSRPSVRKSEQALLLAQELPFSSGWAGALFRDTWLHQFRRESQATYERTEAVLTLATAQGFAEWLVHGSILQGWALAELGQQEKGMTQILNGAATRHAIGSELGRTRDLALLAEAYGKAGRADEGLAALAEAFIQAEKSGERFYEAELYRLKGVLTLQSQASLSQVRASQKTVEFTTPHSPIPTPQAVAEACFLKAIEVARKQQAKSLELRATVSLVRLRREQAKQEAPRTTQREACKRLIEAHQMLSKIYNWFTEGFDTKDLQEAKALLEELESFKG